MAALSAIAAYDVSDAESDEDKDEEDDNLSAKVEILTNLEQDSKKEDKSKSKSADESEPLSGDDDDDGEVEDDNGSIQDADEDNDSMLVSDEDEKESEKNDTKPAKPKFKRYSCESATALAAKLQEMTEEAQLPPEPDGSCSKQLQDKIKRLYEKKIKEGENLNQAIQERKDFRNPSIYDKLILYLGIKERHTNFPKSEFDPSLWSKVPDYEDLARAQREDVAKRERDKKTKVEFVTGTVKKPTTGSGSAEVKKTKWDIPADESKKHSSASMPKPAASSTLSSKTTIIPAVGNIKKNKS